VQAQLLQAQDSLGAARETIRALEAPGAEVPVEVPAGGDAGPAAAATPETGATVSGPARCSKGWRFWRRTAP
jgi:hypothetical protein